MNKNEKHFEELNALIRECRSQEINFDKLSAALDNEIKISHDSQSYNDALLAIKEKSVEGYKKAKEQGGSTWPEFEKFVSEFEKAVIQQLKQD